MTATGRTTGSDPTPSLGDLVRLRAFRQLLFANILSAIAFGSSRFVFVWLVGTLTDWNPATAILGIVIGVPPLALSAWAGALADRMSPRRLAEILFAVAAVGFVVAGVLVVTDVMNVPLAVVCGFLTVVAPSMLMPMMQALVPTVAPPGRLMQAVALQNLCMMVAVMGGIFLGGAVMQIGGPAAGFWLLAAACVLGFVVSAADGLPDRLAGAADVAGTIRDGIRLVAGSEPLRSLLLLTSVFGIAITASVLLLPEFARDVLGQESLAASALNVIMSVGMMITAMLLAARWRPSRPGLVLVISTIAFLGGGLVAIGWSRTYAVTALCCFGWGLSGGIAMTLLRTLTQSNTPPESMGGVMGLVMMAQNGAFPVTALGLFGLVAATDIADAMVITGFAVIVLNTIVVGVRPHVRAVTATEFPDTVTTQMSRSAARPQSAPTD